jgi:hypothetical protein
MHCVYVPIVAAVGGTADDVTVFAGTCPQKYRVACMELRISTAADPSTLTLYNATGGDGGDGAALTTDINCATTGRKVDANTVSSTIAEGGSLYIYRSDNTVAGEALIWLMPTL